MKATVRTLAAILALSPALASAQQYPTVPAQSVIGRLGIPGDTGPSQAVPFKALAAQLGLGANILNYGGKCTGNVADAQANAIALAAALATGLDVDMPWCAAGYNFGTYVVTVGTGQSVRGQNQVTIYSQAANAFRMVGYDKLSSISDLTIDCTGMSVGSAAIRFGTSTAVVYRTRLSRLRMTHCYSAIADEVTASNYIVDSIIHDIYVSNPLGTSISSLHSRGDIVVEDINVDQTGLSAAPTWDAVYFADAVGLQLNRVSTEGPTAASYNGGVYGLHIANSTSVWLNNILVDTTASDGISLVDVNFLNGNWLEVFGTLGSGISLLNVSFSTFSNTFLESKVGAASAKDALNCNGCTNDTFSNTIITLWTGNGVNLIGSTDNSFSALQAFGNTGFGIVESGGSARNSYGSPNLATNTAGNTSGLSSTSCLGTSLLSGAISGQSIGCGGTGATTAAGARTNLGLGTAATQNTGTSGANVPLLNANNTFSGQIISTFGVPTIASGACGTGTNGSITGSNQSGTITIGAVATTSCAVSFSATITAPNACLIFPENAAAAATGTTVARVGAPSATGWTITGSALANTTYGFICL